MKRAVDGARDGRGAEQRERAAAIARFASLDEPTHEDYRAAMDALGVGRTQVQRLARAWRTHGRSRMELGPLRSDDAARAAAIAAAEGPLDLGGFDEDRRDELRRRIRLIGRYLRENTIARSVTDAYAAEWGATYNTFRSAVTAWMLSPRPESLPGVSRWNGGIARARSRVSDEVRGIVRDAIREAGPDASSPAIVRRVGLACYERGLPVPSHQFILTATRESRRAAAIAAGGADRSVALDRVRLEPRQLDLPSGPPIVLAMLFGSDTGRIHAFRLASGPPRPQDDAALLSSYLEDAPDEPGTILEMALPSGRSWAELGEILLRGGVDILFGDFRGMRSGRAAAVSIGYEIGGIPFRRIDADSVAHMAPGSDLDAACAVVSAAVARHNLERPAEGKALGKPFLRAALEDELRRFATPSDAEVPSGT